MCAVHMLNVFEMVAESDFTDYGIINDCAITVHKFNGLAKIEDIEGRIFVVNIL